MKRLLLVGTETLSDDLRDALPSDCEFEVCGGNMDALCRLRARAYDVVVTDSSTPMQDSLPVARELQAARPGVHVIVLAPEATPDEVIEALRAQVFACFTVPFDPRELADIVQQAFKEPGMLGGIEVVSGLPHWITLRVSCGLVTADRLVRFMTEYRSDVPERERDLLMAAFREMLMNAMEHGAGFDPEQVVEVSAAKTKRAIIYHFRDPGGGFSRAGLPEQPFTTHEELVTHFEMREQQGKTRPGGFGTLIVKQIADEVVYNERGNEVLLIKYLD